MGINSYQTITNHALRLVRLDYGNVSSVVQLLGKLSSSDMPFVRKPKQVEIGN